MSEREASLKAQELCEQGGGSEVDLARYLSGLIFSVEVELARYLTGLIFSVEVG